MAQENFAIQIKLQITRKDAFTLTKIRQKFHCLYLMESKSHDCIWKSSALPVRLCNSRSFFLCLLSWITNKWMVSSVTRSIFSWNSNNKRTAARTGESIKTSGKILVKLFQELSQFEFKQKHSKIFCWVFWMKVPGFGRAGLCIVLCPVYWERLSHILGLSSDGNRRAINVSSSQPMEAYGTLDLIHYITLCRQIAAEM